MTRALLSCLFILLLSPMLSTSHSANAAKQDLVRQSCVHATYPKVCLRTLSSYGGAARTTRDLAQVAVRVSLAHVREVSDFLSQLKGSGRREQGALNDCVAQMGDTVEELRKTLTALQHLQRGADFRWQMSNAETWVSAALTNEDTCLDGFKEINGKVRSDVRRKITNVARITSNALYLINLLDEKPASPKP
ncbi:Pectinesterase [Handroanthus impetiginosus]|uniref:Pectinesterase n=1 Tax=Handroanthus impetiginosus TaxID=429701 RepID=A0A2G9HRJ0_9LAMI|nr:Pectinesterase [Handroanthus impetiginosus]